MRSGFEKRGQLLTAMLHAQNFFANVSALVRDMESRIAESSGSHMYHEDERRLMQR